MLSNFKLVLFQFLFPSAFLFIYFLKSGVVVRECLLADRCPCPSQLCSCCMCCILYFITLDCVIVIACGEINLLFLASEEIRLSWFLIESRGG